MNQETINNKKYIPYNALFQWQLPQVIQRLAAHLGGKIGNYSVIDVRIKKSKWALSDFLRTL